MSKAVTAFSIICFSIAAIALSVGKASAAQQSLPSQIRQVSSAELFKPVTHNYRRYCAKQYFICRERWGKGHKFRRCMKWRNCWDAYVRFRERHEDRDDDSDDDDSDSDDNDNSEGYSCRHWKNACAENWGYGNNDYYGCLRYHRCE